MSLPSNLYRVDGSNSVTVILNVIIEWHFNKILYNGPVLEAITWITIVSYYTDCVCVCVCGVLYTVNYIRDFIL